MAHRNPHAAVVAQLTAPLNFTPETDAAFGVKDRVPRASLGFDRPFARDPAAIVVLKDRGSDDRRLYAVSFDDAAGNRWFWLAAAERGEQGWIAHGVAGGSDGPADRKHPTPRPSLGGSGPWLNLCGQWGGDTFYAGGRLDPAGSRIGRVRLTLVDGSELEDDGTAEVALFIGRHGHPPQTVDIFAPDGALLSRRGAF